MKLNTGLALLSFFSMSANAAELRGNRELRGNSKASYTFDCGSFGSGAIDIETGKMDFEVELSGIDTLTGSSSNSLGYHLHTMWTHGDSFTYKTLADCGPSFTGGHYDPTFKCGPASQANQSPQCQGRKAYGCTKGEFNTCEIGDLSGKYGPLVTTNGARSKVKFEDDTKPAKIQEYEENNDEPDPQLWASIVFHKEGGARILCCRIDED